MTKEQALQNKIRVQEIGVNSWVNNNFLGTEELATGSGKSKIAIDCIKYVRNISEKEPLILLVAPTESMRDIDWPEEFAKWNCPMDNIKVICQASLSKTKLDKYDMIVFDEYHNNTVTNLKKIAALKENSRVKLLGLTATLPSKTSWPEELERVQLLQSTIPSIYKVSTDEAVELGLICDFEVQVIKFNLDNKNFNIELKNKPNTTEASHYITLTKNLQKSMFKGGPALKFMRMQERTSFIYNLPSKTRLAKACISRLLDRKEKFLVMAGSVAQANELCGEYVYHSESSSEYLDKFQNDEIPYLGAVKALDEGKNLNNLRNLLVTQVQSGERRLIQRIGRVVRIDYNNMDSKALIIILVGIINGGISCDEKWYRSAVSCFETKRIKEFILTVPPCN